MTGNGKLCKFCEIDINIFIKSRMKTNNEYLNNIIIVGTNRASLHSDSQMQESMANFKFETIREALRGQAMENNVCQMYFAVDETQESDHCQNEMEDVNEFSTSSIFKETNALVCVSNSETSSEKSPVPSWLTSFKVRNVLVASSK